jgi:hypothetical protein
MKVKFKFIRTFDIKGKRKKWGAGSKTVCIASSSSDEFSQCQFW